MGRGIKPIFYVCRILSFYIAYFISFMMCVYQKNNQLSGNYLLSVILPHAVSKQHSLNTSTMTYYFEKRNVYYFHHFCTIGPEALNKETGFTKPNWNVSQISYKLPL